MNELNVDTLISQTIDGDITDPQWRQFVAIAEAEPKLWRRLAEAQRDQGALSRAMDGSIEVASAVIIPSPQQVWEHKFQEERANSNPLRRLASWGGWAVAALVAIVAAAQLNSMSSVQMPGGKAGVGETITRAATTAAEALQDYLAMGAESGDVLGEVPTKVLVETRPAEGGHGYEVVFIRQIMERTIVPDLYQVTGENEAGQPALVRWERPARNSM